jgi:hypothetical protein
MKVVLIDKTDLAHRRNLCFGGAMCDLHTNSIGLAGILEGLAGAVDDEGVSKFCMQVVVNNDAREPAGSPHFRGLHHLVTASFGNGNVFLFDLLRRKLSASISATLANDSLFSKEKLIPIALGVLGASMGLVPVHCACLSWNGEGLLVAGMSGAGKSTLSVALAQAGFSYVSDDWTYMSCLRGAVVAHGTSAPVKLLPDAVRHFGGLNRHALRVSMNGELAYEVDVMQTFGGFVERGCEPRWLIFLERMQQPGRELTPMSSMATRRYIEASVERLPAELSEATRLRTQMIDNIARLPCWSFRYGGPPGFAAECLREFVVARCNQEIVA